MMHVDNFIKSFVMTSACDPDAGPPRPLIMEDEKVSRERAINKVRSISTELRKTCKKYGKNE